MAWLVRLCRRGCESPRAWTHIREMCSFVAEGRVSAYGLEMSTPEPPGGLPAVPRLGVFIVKLCYQHASGHCPLLSVVLVDGGEGRIGARRRRDVVETDNGNVLGHGDPPLGHPFDSPKRELVAQGEDGCWNWRPSSPSRLPAPPRYTMVRSPRPRRWWQASVPGRRGHRITRRGVGSVLLPRGEGF